MQFHARVVFAGTNQHVDHRQFLSEQRLCQDVSHKFARQDPATEPDAGLRRSFLVSTGKVQRFALDARVIRNISVASTAHLKLAYRPKTGEEIRFRPLRRF